MPEGMSSAEEVLRRNHVKTIGAGSQPMLFAHGFGCDQNMWRFMVPAFERDYRVVLFDYVGAGHSVLGAYDPIRYAALDGYARDVLEVCAALELQNVIFVGHSVSSIIGALAAIAKPDLFAQLIMIGPSPRYLNDAPDYVGGFERPDLEALLEVMDRNFIGWAASLAPLIMKNPDRPELAAELEGSFCSTDPVVARQFAKATFFGDNRADLARVPVPTLVLQCAEDAIAPSSVGEFVARELPVSTLRHMKATGHCPHMSHPEETIALIKEYLGRGDDQ